MFASTSKVQREESVTILQAVTVMLAEALLLVVLASLEAATVAVLSSCLPQTAIGAVPLVLIVTDAPAARVAKEQASVFPVIAQPVSAGSIVQVIPAGSVSLTVTL